MKLLKKLLKKFLKNPEKFVVRLIALITIVLILLRVTRVITWSWLWVLSPAWLFALLVVFFHGVFFLWMLFGK